MVRPLPAASVAEGADPLDIAASPSDAPPGAGRRWALRRLALGLSPIPRSTIVLLLAGAAIGPRGLGVLSESALDSLDPALSVALAALGVLIGLDVTVRSARDLRLLGGAILEGAVTMIVVAAGIVAVASQIGQPRTWLFAAMVGICAASSATSADGSGGARAEALHRIGDLDDLLPIVLAPLALAWMRPDDAPRHLLIIAANGAIIAVAIAIAGSLLVTQTASESEQRVFVIGALLLLGGAAAYLALPALFTGLAAGLFWTAARGAARQRVARDAKYLQHPLVVLLLIVAGSRLQLHPYLINLGAAFVVLRIAGKAIGGWTASLVVRELPAAAGVSLLGPGLTGIAIALNVAQRPDDVPAAAVLFNIVVAGALASEVVSMLVERQRRAA